MGSTTDMRLIDNKIVLTENEITLSDVKLRQIIADVYERAHIDLAVAKIQKLSWSFLSIASTLLLTLLTATFNDIGVIKGEVVMTIVCILCVGCFFAFVGTFVYSKLRRKTAFPINTRNIAVDKIMEDILQSGKKIQE